MSDIHGIQQLAHACHTGGGVRASFVKLCAHWCQFCIVHSEFVQLQLFTNLPFSVSAGKQHLLCDTLLTVDVSPVFWIHYKIRCWVHVTCQIRNSRKTYFLLTLICARLAKSQAIKIPGPLVIVCVIGFSIVLFLVLLRVPNLKQIKFVSTRKNFHIWRNWKERWLFFFKHAQVKKLMLFAFLCVT